VAAVGGRDRRDYGQAKAGAPSGARPVAAREALEGPLGELGLKARAVVYDVQLHDGISRHRLKAHLVGGITKRVIEHVPERLLEVDTVNLHSDSLLDGRRDGPPHLPSPRLEPPSCRRPKLVHVDLSPANR
jgi:hypothetical protein